MAKHVQQFFGRFLTFFIVSAGIIAGTVLVRSFPPPSVLYSDIAFNWTYTPPEWNSSEYLILLDSHSHTYHSDGILSPEQNILWHKAHGFNAAVITDHHAVVGSLEALAIAQEKHPDFIVITGMEWTTSRIHMNLVGITENVPYPLGTPTDHDIQVAINATHAQGGVVIVCHIPWSTEGTPPRMPTHPTRDQLLAWGVDYIEIVNEHTYDHESEVFCTDNGVGKITGTDMHGPDHVVGWTALNATSFTAGAVMDALRARKTMVIYNATGSLDFSTPPVDNPLHVPLRPIIYIGNAFVDMYYGGPVVITLGVLYLLGAFLVAEALRVVKWKYWARRHAVA